MVAMVELINDGSVTSAKGFTAGGTYAGLKTQGEGVLDLGILLSDTPANLAATFSTNKVLSPSVVLSRQRAQRGAARGVVANSGCANCCVGDQGLTDAAELTELAAAHTGVAADDMLVCSTGMIGVELPMALLRQNVGNVRLSADGGHDFAHSIMTYGHAPQRHRGVRELGRAQGDYRRRRQGRGDDPPEYGDDAGVCGDGRPGGTRLSAGRA